ncbi:putative aldouronate transport system substrate-binding protein [Kibdelosporangium banguiense]|uniref:Aldouronate transport system substrate-binding protein n=1 Tax=Kibdelosporangium banguiense TaxID=1365924 RepID=A0ABS4TKG6_9PSEU|nr:extracellular solute-binding protein [Kibdelosporangium banguiense]MBP2324916.1 putative aldouronate transport system substrate-binding protein [Kibdelosporangium banguiense]
MRKCKRVLLALAAGSLVAGLTACSDDGSAESGVNLDGKRVAAMSDYKAGSQFKATEPINVSLLYLDQAHYPIKNDWLLWSEITKRTNVKIEPTVVPYSDYDQKRGLLISSGNAPMIISKTYPGQEEAFVASGAILPVSDYIDLMPNLKDKIEKWKLQPELNTLRQDDGKFYVLPGVLETVQPDYTVAFRTDELTRLGLSAPKTWDEFYTVLKAIKAAHPDVYPFSDRFEGKSILNQVGQGFGTYGGDNWGYVKNISWNENKQSFDFTGTTPEYRQLIEYFHKLVAEGLMDPESFTQKDDQAKQKFASGKSYAISSNAQNIANDYRPNITKIPGATVAKIRVPAGPKGDIMRGTRMDNGLMISAKALQNDKFVAMMQFIDWLWYSPEGMEFAKWGVPGVTYDKDAAGKRTLKSDIAFGGMNAGAPKNLQRDFGFQGGVFAYGGSTELYRSMYTPEEVTFQEEMASKKVVPLPPPAPFNEAEREKATLWEAPLKDYVQQNTLQFILGKRDLSTWDAYVKELDSKGMPQYMEMVNGAHKRYKEKNG